MLRSKGGSVIPGKGLYMTPEGKGFKEAVQLTALSKRPNPWSISGEHYGVDIRLFFDSRRPDINNPTKLILDALEGVAYNNDRAVHTLIQRKALDRDNPRVEISVWRY